MRFEHVETFGFGALGNEKLSLAPGMTVVAGPNEAFKSTWHAAIYAALCGRRRGQGRGRVEDQQFVRRHKPWDGGRWRVVGTLALNDGRSIQITQELDNASRGKAFDLILNRDLTSDIVNEGSPDGSMWLGLDRKSFAATACIRQADVLSILEGAEALQEHLQRAAATAGTSETAAEALQMLSAFMKDNVGQAIRNSTKPLQTTSRAVAAAEAQLDEAKRLHNEYLELARRVETAAAEADDANARLVQTENEFRAKQETANLAREARRRGEREEAQRTIDDAAAVVGLARKAQEDARAESKRAVAVKMLAVEDARSALAAATEMEARQTHTLESARMLAEEGLRRQAHEHGERLVDDAAEKLHAAEAERQLALVTCQGASAEAQKQVHEAIERAELSRNQARHAFAALAEANEERATGVKLSVEAQTALDLAERALADAVDRVEATRERLDSVRRLTELTGKDLRGPVDDDRTVGFVISALQAWDERPTPAPLSGTTSSELDSQLAALPQAPAGDTEPDRTVLDSAEQLRALSAAVRQHASRKPSDAPRLPAYDSDELEFLASSLTNEDAGIAGEVELARKRVSVGVGLMVAAVILTGLAVSVIGPAGLGAVVTLVASAAYWRRSRNLHRSACESAEESLGRKQMDAQARHRCTELGLPTDPGILRQRVISLAVTQAEAARATKDAKDWADASASLDVQWQGLLAQLAGALSARGMEIPPGVDLNHVVDAYVNDCHQRGQQARLASGRSALQEALRIRKYAETEAESAEAARNAATDRLREAASMCGLDGGLTDPERVSQALRDWQSRRSTALEAEQERLKLWAQRNQLLNGGTEDDLVQTLEQLDGQVLLERQKVELARADSTEAALRAQEQAEVAGAALAAHSEAEKQAEQAEAAARGLSTSAPTNDDQLSAADERLELARQAHSAAVALAATLLQQALEGFELDSMPEAAAAADARREVSSCAAALSSAEHEAASISSSCDRQRDELAAALDDATANELLTTQRLAAALDASEAPLEAEDDDCGPLRQLHGDLVHAAAELRGSLDERRLHLVDVAERAEYLAQARAEHERVIALRETLETTRRFLEQAQDRVHKDIAPALAAKVTDWLPLITDGRYVGCSVDPAKLKLRVFDALRQDYEAELMSRGTLEQIYLLLRVAIADLIVEPGETCPLLLDDVTVHCDSKRKVAVLDLLHELSRDRQIIVFSQEKEVSAWAQANLRDRDSLVELRERGRPALIPTQRSQGLVETTSS